MLWLANSLIVDAVGPPVEVIGYLLIPLFAALGDLDIGYLLAFTTLVFGFGAAISIGALVLEEMELRRYPTARGLMVLTLAAVAENFGYRQINTLWRVAGWWRLLRGAKEWGIMTPAGFSRV